MNTTQCFKECELDLLKLFHEYRNEVDLSNVYMEGLDIRYKLNKLISDSMVKISSLISKVTANMQKFRLSKSFNEQIQRTEEMISNCPSIGNKKVNIPMDKIAASNNTMLKPVMTVNQCLNYIRYVTNKNVNKKELEKKKAETIDKIKGITSTMDGTPEKELYDEVFKLYTSTMSYIYTFSDVCVMGLIHLIDPVYDAIKLRKEKIKSLILSVHQVDKEDKSDIDDIIVKWKGHMIDSITVNGIPVALYTVPNGNNIQGELNVWGHMIMTDLSSGVCATYPNARGYAIIVMDRRVFKSLPREEIVAILYHEIGHMTTQFNGSIYAKKSVLYHKNVYKERTAYMKDLEEAFAQATAKYGSDYCDHLSLDELEADYRACRNGMSKSFIDSLTRMYKPYYKELKSKNKKRAKIAKEEICEFNIRVFVIEYMRDKGYFK